MLLGRPQGDRDYLVVGATAERFLARYPGARQVGKSFPVFILEGCEYAWPRGGTLESDLSLRDLTINSLAMGADNREQPGLIHAHPRAFADLQARILRPASPTSMADDPVRVFRAARFAAQLPDFSASPELIAQMRAVAESGALAQPAAERMGAEVRKALAAPRPSRFLELLHRAGCLSPWLQELAGADEIPGGPPQYHDKSVLGHTCEVMDKLAGDPLAVWMALVHDLGKTLTPREAWPKHHGHDEAGEPLAEAMGWRLRLPRTFVEAGVLGCHYHMRTKEYPTLRPHTVVDMLMALEAKRLTSKLFKLGLADSRWDRWPQARHELKVVKAVRLPDDKKDQGEDSGRLLRQMRCDALAADRQARTEINRELDRKADRQGEGRPIGTGEEKKEE